MNAKVSGMAPNFCDIFFATLIEFTFKSSIRVSKYITEGDVTRMKVKYKKKKRPQKDLLKLTNQVSFVFSVRKAQNL